MKSTEKYKHTHIITIADIMHVKNKVLYLCRESYDRTLLVAMASGESLVKFGKMLSGMAVVM